MGETEHATACSRAYVQPLADVRCLLEQLHSRLPLLLDRIKLLLGNCRLDLCLNLARLLSGRRLNDSFNTGHERDSWRSDGRASVI